MGKAPIFTWIYFLTLVFSHLELSEEADVIGAEGSISDSDTLVSSLETFELGFFSPGKSRNRYLGIWYKNNPGAVVWVANRNNPIAKGKGVLNDTGNLLLNQTNTMVWLTDMSGAARNPVAQLLDTGNLVLKDNKSMPESYLWQSFEHPSDTLLPSMKIGWNLKTGEERYLTSWTSADDLSLGSFTYRLEKNRLPQLFIDRGSVKIYRIGPWNGIGFGGVPVVPNLVFKPIVISNENEVYHTYKPATPFDICGSYGSCGVNNICSSRRADACECIKGFLPKYCQKGEGFIRLNGVKVLDLLKIELNESLNRIGYEAECLKNCSCTTFANVNVSEGHTGCLMWFGDLFDITEVSNMYRGEDVFMRLSASGLGLTHDSKKKNRIAIILVSIISSAIILGLISFIIWKRFEVKHHRSFMFINK
ncbi:hypothetical protein V6Z11_A11G323700 [Gossypium hirsutum]